MEQLATITLLVRSYDEAIEFFTGVLGFELLEDTQLSKSKRWVRVSPDGGGVALLLARADGPAQEAQIGDSCGGRVALFLTTDDLEARHREWGARGVHFEGPIRSEPYGKVVVFHDLYGNRWDLIADGTR